ncbi:orotate phosphoribosyltransferase [Thermodesulfobacteriota bacterium]
MKQVLIDMLCSKSVHCSIQPRFRLVSGKLSDFYVDCKPTIMHPRGMFLVGNLVLDAIDPLKPHGVGGVTFGADPIAMATAFASELRGSPVKAFSIRKEQKDHGTTKWIEGDMHPGERVAIVDDVVTTGGSTIRAVQRARSGGLEVVKVVILVDRQEGGMEKIREQVADVSSIVTRKELVHRWTTLQREETRDGQGGSCTT